MKYILNLMLIVLFFTFTLISCKKSDYLAEKPNKGLILPSTLKDFNAILENVTYMNGSGVGLVPALAEAGADNYYIVSSMFTGDLNAPFYKNVYTWNDRIYQDITGIQPADWGFAYRCVYYANTVLEGLAKITPSAEEQSTYNRLKASALFYRAHGFYWAAQIFAPHYSQSSANTDLGIPLKMSADINEPITRATLQQTYDRIIGDLNEALSGLPDVPAYITRPSKLAVYGMLSRIYLNTKEYNKALEASSLYLSIKSDLLDFNSITGSSNFIMPVRTTNPEITFYSILTKRGMEGITPYPARVDSNLFASYNTNDLRRKFYFRDASVVYGIPGDFGYYFRGSYDRSANLFAGIATDEIFLTKAECQARLGNKEDALLNLNTLLKKRWSNAVIYNDVSASNSDEALNIILSERRKELLFRGLRWTDLRRLNADGANITITRNINGEMYTLLPNSLLYTYLIPQDVINFNPGLPQNLR